MYQEPETLKSEPDYISFAREISAALLKDFNSEQQAEFMCALQQNISLDYENRIDERKKELESTKEQYNSFKERLPSSPL